MARAKGGDESRLDSSLDANRDKVSNSSSRLSHSV